MLAFVAFSGVQCVQDLLVTPPNVTYVFSLTPDSAVVNVGDTVAPFGATLKADGQEVGFTLGLTVIEGASVARVDSLSRLIVTGRGVARLRAQPLSVALPVDTIADTVTAWAVVPRLTAGTPGTEDTLQSLGEGRQLVAVATTRSGAVIPGADVRWTQVSGQAYATLLDTTGRVTAVANGVAEFEATSDTAHARRTVRVVQRPTTLINTADTVKLRALGQVWALGATLRDARANAVTQLSPTWTSKNTGIATVSSGGQITAVGEGTTQIIASYAGVTPALADTTTVIVQQGRLSLLSGNAQSGTVGAALAAPLVVQLVDGTGSSMRDSGVVVIYRVTSGGGHFGAATDTLRTADTVRTDLQGQARTTPRLGRLVGANAFSASGSGLAGTALAFTATGTPAPARTMAAESGMAQTDTVGRVLAQAFVVSVKDTFGNAVSGVRVAFVVTAGGGNFGGWDSVITTTDTLGRARTQFDQLGPAPTALTLGSVAGANVVEARAAVPVGAPVTFTATAVPGRAWRLDFTVEPTSVEAGRSITPALQVTVRDTFGNRATAATSQLALGILAGSGTAGARVNGTTAVSAVDGVATFPADVTVDSVGTGYRLLATATGLQSDTSVAFDVTPGALDNLAFLTPPTMGVAGRVFDPALQVVLRDANGNRVTSARVDVQLDVYTVGVGGSASLFGTPTVAAVNGVATFDDVGLGAAGTRYRLRARVLPALQPAVISNYFDVRGAPTSIQVVSGNNQNGAAGAALAESLVVRVLDASGRGIPRDTVVFDVTAGGGSIGGGSTLRVPTDTAGRAAARLTLGPGDGANTVTARSVSLSSQTVTFTATGVSGALHLDFIVQPATVNVGATFSAPLQVQVRDAANQAVTTATPHITLAITSGTGRAGATLTGTLEADAVNGVATFPGVGVSRSGTAFTITASAGGSFTSAVSAAFDVRQYPTSVGPASADRQNGLVGTALAEDFVVRVTDAAGDPIPGDSVVFKIASGGGSLGGGVSPFDSVVVLTDVQGLARARLTLPSTPGEVIVIAWAVRNALGAGRPTFYASATAAERQLEFVTQPSTVAVGSAITPAVQVRVRDASGVTDATATTNIQLAITSGSGSNPSAALQGRTVVAAVSGVATFDSLVVSGVGTGFTLTASATGLVPDTSTAFAATSGGAAGLQAQGTPGPATAGAPFAATVRVVDGSGNLVTTSSAAVTVEIASGRGPAGARLTGTLTVNAVNGVAQFTDLVIDSAATIYAVTFTAAGLAAVTTNEFAVSPGAPARLAFEAAPGAATAGVALTPAIRVWVLDALGNRVTTATNAVTVSLPGSSVSFQGTTVVAAVNGVATFADLVITRRGEYQIEASAAGLTSKTSASFTVNAAVQSRLAFVVQPTNAAPGAVLSPALQVAVHDAYGNVVGTGVSITVAITAGTGTAGAALAGTATRTAVNGVATFDDLNIATAGTNYTLTATATMTPAVTSGVSIPFSILATTAERLVFVVQPPSAVAGAAFGTTVLVAVQDGLGNTITTASPAIQLAVTTNTGTAGAVLLGTTTQIAASGVAAFPGVRMEVAGSDYTLTATASGLASGTSAAFTVLPAAPARLEFQTQPGSRTAGNVFTPPVQVALRDAFNNLATTTTANVTADITPATASGAVLAGTRTVTSVTGVATFADLSIAKTGTGYTLTATASELTPVVSGTFSITAGPVARIAVSPASVTLVGEGAQQQFSATAYDAYGNVVPGVTMSWGCARGFVAGIAQTGLATANGAGQVSCTAAADGVLGHAVVNVSVPEMSPVNLWAPMPSGTTADLKSVWGTYRWHVYATGATTCDQPTTVHLGQSGAWSTLTTGAGACLTGLYGTHSSSILASGSFGQLRSYDGVPGHTWEALNSGTSVHLTTVWAGSTADVFAVGETGAIVRASLGPRFGESTIREPELMPSGVNGWLWGVFGTSASNVVAVGEGGAMVRYDGWSWSRMTSPTTENITDVWGTGANSLYATARHGVLRWNGSAWSVMGTSEGITGEGIWGGSDRDVYVVGAGGGIWRYDGSTWFPMTSGTTANLHDVFGTPDWTVFAVGDGGTILRGLRGAGVTVGPSGTTLTALGATQQLTAEATSPGMEGVVPGVTYTWTSDNPAVAAVDASGVVTAVANGTANIIATAPGGASGYTLVTVRQAPASISMPTGYVGGVGGTWTPPAEARDARGNLIESQAYAWSSLNPAVATVDPATGVVTFVDAGQAVIAATAGDATGYTIAQAIGSGAPVNLWAQMGPIEAITRLEAVWGASATDVFAVGDDGVILHYDGTSWTRQSSGTVELFRAVWGFSGNYVYAAGRTGIVLRYDGSSWSPLTTGIYFQGEAVWGFSPRDVYVAGNGGGLFRFDGTTWSPLASGTPQPVLGVYSATGPLWAVGEQGTLLRNWEAQPSGTSANLTDLWGDPGNMFAVGAGGTIIRWNETVPDPPATMASGTTADLIGVWGAQPADVYAVGGAGTILRYDGSAWAPMASGTTVELRGVWGTGHGSVFAVGEGSTILRGVRGATVTVTPATPTLTALSATQQLTAQARESGGAVVPGVAFTWRSDNPAAVTVDANGLVTAVANGTAQITATVPGGAAGSTVVSVSQVAKTLAVSRAGASVSGVGSTTTFGVTAQDSLGNAIASPVVTWASLNLNVATVGASDGLVTALAAGQVTIRATSGGATGYAVVTVSVPGLARVNLWAPMTSGTTDGLSGVWGTSGSDVFAVGGTSILHYDGTTWSTVFRSHPYLLMDVWGSSSADVYAVGYGGKVVHYDGTFWSVMEGGTSGMLSAVWGASPADIYAVSWDGTIVHFNGTSWRPMSSGNTTGLEGVWGTSASDVYATGQNQVLHYDGTSWNDMSNGVDRFVKDVWATSPTDIYAAGMGNVFHSHGTSFSRILYDAPVNIRAIWGSDSTDVYFAGADSVGQATVVRYNGTSWAMMGNLAPQPLEAIWGSPSGRVFAVGGAGTILQGHRGAMVSVAPANPTLTALGATRQLAAEARASGGAVVPGATFTWASSDTTKVRVSGTGLVTAVANGSATIAATAPGGVAGTAAVTVAVAANAALDFSNDWVEVPDSPSLDLDTTWTIEAWIYPRNAASGANQDIISKWGFGDASYGLQIGPDGRLQSGTFQSAPSQVQASRAALLGNVWQHVAVTFDHGTVRLYINGVLDTTVTDVRSPMNSTQPLAFGREGLYDGYPYDGVLDEVRIWNIVRTGQELQAYKTQRLSGSESRLVGLWRLDEATGDTAADATANGNHGRLGSAVGSDSRDPNWVTSATPVGTPPVRAPAVLR